MSATGSDLNFRKWANPIRSIRIILVVNFVLILALIGPGSGHKLDLALRRAGLARIISSSLQIWFVGSTILSTALFAVALVKKSDVDLHRFSRPTKLDWVLLLTWWAALILISLFAFMMGFGG